MTAKLAVFTLAVIVALGGLGAGFIRAFETGNADAVEPVELRKDDSGADLAAEEEDDDRGDGDSTRGDDGTRGGDNTGDRDSTRGNDGTRGGDNTGDRDSTRGGDNTGDGDATFGNDGTAGGDNTYAAPANPSYDGGGESGDGYSTG
jgi:hypothetical protein